MKIFLSYPSAERALADQLALALEAEGHEVFIDRADLKAGEGFHQRLREAILGADAMVFLVTPAAVAPGSYTLAELAIARQRWRRPGGHVLPVMVAPTPMAALPPYLAAVTVLQPAGHTVAEVVAAVARLKPAPSRGRRAVVMAALTTGVVLAIALGWVQLQRMGTEREAASARQDTRRSDLAQAQAAAELCQGGSHAMALARFGELVVPAPSRMQPQPEVLHAREDCAMAWLREMRATLGRTTFAEQVAQVQPVLAQGLAGGVATHDQAGGAATQGQKGEAAPQGPAGAAATQALPADAARQRSADLRAHFGWGEYLRGRDGIGGVDPVAHWQRALVDDPANPYAHAMWARQMLDRPDRLDTAKAHFDKAVASGRARPFVRTLQFGATLGGGADVAAYAVAVADEMRRNAEPVSDDLRDRLWNGAFGAPLLNPGSRAKLTAALPPQDMLATYVWLYPKVDVPAHRQVLWRYGLAVLQARAGEGDAARAGYESLLKDLQAPSLVTYGGVREAARRDLRALQGADATGATVSRGTGATGAPASNSPAR
jgi:hypothetical protein